MKYSEIAISPLDAALLRWKYRANRMSWFSNHVVQVCSEHDRRKPKQYFCICFL